MARDFGGSDHPHVYSHGHGELSHTHGAVDPSISASERGIWAVKWSFIGLFATALIQIVVVLLSGSVALLSDTIHNFGDAATAAVPLWIAFALSRLRPSLNHRLLHELRYIDRAVVHVDPVQESGEEHHRIGPHSHDGIPTHSH